MEPNVEYTQGERLIIHLTRPDSNQSWGFRLQGGMDFSTPLSIQVVQPNSVAEYAGLQAGDGILYINRTNADSLSHEQAKMEIIRSANDITLGVLRGAVKVWKPLVTPMSDLRPAHLNTIQTATGDEIAPVQKTSLQMKQPETLKIDGFNRSARGFPAGDTRVPDSPKCAVPNVVHAQFNSPIGMYSPENIADSFRTQTAGIQSQFENLDVGNKPVGSKMTVTYQDIRNQPPKHSALYQDPAPDDIPLGMEVGPEGPAGHRSVTSPITRPADPAKQAKQESNRCGECDMLVTGVFVRVKGIPYHVNCFKCITCQVNLKQKGYFLIEGKLYCDIHAKRVSQPPGPNMVATAIYR